MDEGRRSSAMRTMPFLAAHMQCALRAVDIFGIWQIEAVSSFDDYLGWVKRLSVASSRVRRNLLSPMLCGWRLVNVWGCSGV